MKGPVAPKDPTVRRQGFYILLDKQVGGIPQDDGAGRHSIFMSPERIRSFARVTGGIEDEKTVEMLTTAAGFRQLVHSVGVAVTTEDPGLTVDFAMIFSGKKGPGSHHAFRIPGSGEEGIIELGQLEWSDDDVAPAEFFFGFPTSETLATVSVKFYVNDGYTVPQHDPDPPVDVESILYQQRIARSFLSGGNNYRIKEFLRRARAGEEVTVAFLGGSITQGAGAVPLQENCYARRTYEMLRDKYGRNLRYIKAGVGGTPSETGLMRYDRDITRDGSVTPDLVVLEFAVNDEGDETEGVFYESLVRKILNASERTAVILLFAVFANDWNLKSRLAPIGYRYQVPMVDVLEAVSPQFNKPEGRVITKRQYFYDVYHPSNLGHKIMADSLMYLIDRVDEQQPDPKPEGYIAPCYGSCFESLRLLDRKDGAPGAVVHSGSFRERDEDLQCVPLDFDRENTPMFPYNWMKGAGDEPFVLELECRALALEFKDSGNPRFGKALVKVDGELIRILDPREAGWTHCHTTVLFQRQSVRRHRVEIQMAPEDRDKVFTILGFGYTL